MTRPRFRSPTPADRYLIAPLLVLGLGLTISACGGTQGGSVSDSAQPGSQDAAVTSSSETGASDAQAVATAPLGPKAGAIAGATQMAEAGSPYATPEEGVAGQALVFAEQTGAPSPISAQGSSDCPANLICNADAAIAASLARFPGGGQPEASVARLLTWRSVAAWHGRMHDPEGSDAEKAIWLVALRDPSLTLSDIWGKSVAGDRNVGGVWDMWEASGGALLSSGTLEPEGASSLTFSSAEALADEDLPLEAP